MHTNMIQIFEEKKNENFLDKYNMYLSTFEKADFAIMMLVCKLINQLS